MLGIVFGTFFGRLSDQHAFKKIGKSTPGYSIFKSVENVMHETSTDNSVSFDEFLIARVMKNWIPYYKICSPCTIKYNHIVKLDFAKVDEKLVSM